MKLSDCKRVMKQHKLKIGNIENGKWKAKTKKQMLQEIEEIEERDTMIGSGAGASTSQDDKNNVFIKNQKINHRAKAIVALLTKDHDEYSHAFFQASIPVRNEVRKQLHFSGNRNHPDIYIEKEI
jgi:hypothetical protein